MQVVFSTSVASSQPYATCSFAITGVILNGITAQYLVIRGKDQNGESPANFSLDHVEIYSTSTRRF
jgi:hypothetical protein